MTERARLHADPAPSPGPAHTRRLALLDQLSERLEVVAPPTNTGSGRVHFGALVTVEDASGDLQSFRILGADEMEGALEAGALAPVTGHPTSAVSVTGPIGRALMGRQLDDVVTAHLPRGRVRYTVLTIDYPDAPV